MSSSGKGQSLLRGPDDVPPAWDYAASGGRVNQGRVIVEGLIDFDYEITLLTVRARGAGGVIETSFCEPIGHLQVAGDYVESWQPQAMSAVALEKARSIAAAVTGSLGGRGLFGVELFVKGDQVWFSEVSPRPHDTGLVTLCSQHFSEFELHARAILGLPVDTRLREPGASAVIYGGSDAKGIAFEGIAEALARSAQRPAPVRQTRGLPQTPHGRGGGQRRRCGRRAGARKTRGEPGQAGGRVAATGGQACLLATAISRRARRLAAAPSAAACRAGAGSCRRCSGRNNGRPEHSPSSPGRTSGR
jgi:phosphoribosylglycinamide formyltransferase 2